MSNFPWLTTIGVIPLIGAVVVMLLPRSKGLLAKQLALVFSLIALGMTIAMALQFDADVTDPFSSARVHRGFLHSA